MRSSHDSSGRWTRQRTSRITNVTPSCGELRARGPCPLPLPPRVPARATTRPRPLHHLQAERGRGADGPGAIRRHKFHPDINLWLGTRVRAAVPPPLGPAPPRKGGGGKGSFLAAFDLERS